MPSCPPTGAHLDEPTVTEEPPARWRDAALQAAHQLELFAAAAEPRTATTLATALGAGETRLRALLDVLVFEGALGKKGEQYFAGLVPTRPLPELPRQGLGLLADVLLRDQPLPDSPVLGTASPELRRFHEELRRSSAAAAEELAGLVAPLLAGQDQPQIVDLGAGLGVYSAAILEKVPAAKALLVDRPDVLKLAAPRDRVKHLAGDFFDADLGSGNACVLLVNVLQLCGPRDGARLVLRAARTLAPGGVLVVQDLFIEPDRSGPEAALYAALGLALTTRRGEVHAVPLIDGWLRAAGLFRSGPRRLSAAPDAVVMVGHRS